MADLTKLKDIGDHFVSGPEVVKYVARVNIDPKPKDTRL
jgi:hypothetical protein